MKMHDGTEVIKSKSTNIEERVYVVVIIEDKENLHKNKTQVPISKVIIAEHLSEVVANVKTSNSIV